MAITIKELTGGEIQGNGNLDELLRTFLDHIKREFDEGRITEQNYSTVYLNGFNNVLQVASQFTLQAAIQSQQELLMQENVKNAEKQGELIDAQIRQIEANINIAEYQLATMMPKQVAQMDSQIHLTDEQTLTQRGQTTLVATQNSKVLKDIDLVDKQEDLVDEQIRTAKDAYTDPTGGTNKAQFDKVNEEKRLVTQRIVTETAQTVGTTTTLGGLVGSEMALKEEQKESFVRDAEQKAAKFYADVFSIIFSTNPASSYSDPGAWGLGQTDSADVLEKVREGIGL